MAKKALIIKQNKEHKYKVQNYTRCKNCGRPHSVIRKFKLCRIWNQKGKLVVPIIMGAYFFSNI